MRDEVERRAIDAALNFLSYRQRTAAEVRRKLVDRGFSAGTVDAAMRRLEDVGLVDDESFVGAYVRDRIAHRPIGLRRLTRELYLKGVPRSVSLPVIEQVLEEEGTDERALARRVVERRRSALNGPVDDLPLARRRLRDHLLRRGFDPRLVRDLIDELLADGGPGPER